MNNTDKLKNAEKLTSRSGFDWNLVKGFLAVLEQGSLSAAAKTLEISQSTLSRHVDEMEQSLGVVLFERGRRGAEPTPAALAIADHAREVLVATQAMSLAATGKSRELRGTIRITASQIVATYLLPPILARLLARAPEVEVELVATDKVESLSEREADIAVRMVRPEQSNLIARKVNDIALGVYAHRDYLEGRAPVNNPQDLAAHRVIGYDRDPRIIDGLAQAGIKVERGFFRWRCDDQVVCWRALCDGAGIGFAPNYMAHNHPELEKLAHEFQIAPLPVWLVTHREIKANRRIRMVFDFLAQELASLDLS